MISIEKLHFLREEVLVTKPRLDKDILKNDPFADKATAEDKSSYDLMEVLKVGEKQKTVKPGDLVLIAEQFLQTIRIKGQGQVEGIYKINSTDPIFAIYAQS